MKRKIINIDQEKCNGCKLCIPNCPEGAIQIIDGKARLVSDLLCDGIGACLGHCPQNAITIQERETEPYDEFKVMENISKQGINTIKAHLKHLSEHNQNEYLEQAIKYLNDNNIPLPDYKEPKQEAKLACGCPGSMSKDLRQSVQESCSCSSGAKIAPKINNWPIQLTLINPDAPYLKNADLLIAADCSAFAYNNFHNKFVMDKILIVFCPKLDKNLDDYVDKLARIFATQDIKSITIVHMEVPCCHGIETIVQKALAIAQKNIIIKDYTVSLTGELV